MISQTGPYTGTVLSDAIRRPHSVQGETRLLWRADRAAAGQRMQSPEHINNDTVFRRMEGGALVQI